MHIRRGGKKGGMNIEEEIEPPVDSVNKVADTVNEVEHVEEADTVNNNEDKTDTGQPGGKRKHKKRTHRKSKKYTGGRRRNKKVTRRRRYY